MSRAAGLVFIGAACLTAAGCAQRGSMVDPACENPADGEEGFLFRQMMENAGVAAPRPCTLADAPPPRAPLVQPPPGFEPPPPPSS